jgi:DNA anti-recombination protein RmuC
LQSEEVTQRTTEKAQRTTERRIEEEFRKNNNEIKEIKKVTERHLRLSAKICVICGKLFFFAALRLCVD